MEAPILTVLTKEEREKISYIVSTDKALKDTIDHLVQRRAKLLEERNKWFDAVFERAGIPHGTKAHFDVGQDKGFIREGWVEKASY